MDGRNETRRFETFFRSLVGQPGVRVLRAGKTELGLEQEPDHVVHARGGGATDRATESWNMTADMVLAALNMALHTRRPPTVVEVMRDA